MININGLQINGVAVLVATFVSFFFGFLWYTMIFAKAWTKEMGYDPNKRPGKKEVIKGMVLMVISNFLFCWVLAFYFAGWRLLPGSPAEVGAIAFAINSALSVCIGFFVPIQLGRVVWEKHSWKLFSINTGYHLVSTIAVALILALWK